MSQQPRPSREPRAIALHARRADLIVKATVLAAIAWGIAHYLTQAL
jgi:hypothetical protein